MQYIIEIKILEKKSEKASVLRQVDFNKLLAEGVSEDFDFEHSTF